MWRALYTAAKFVGVVHVTTSYLCSVSIVHGPSMLPTFNSAGDVVLSHRLSRLYPGDVIFIRSPNDPNMIVGKRLIGLEGHRVKFFDPHRLLFKHSSTVVPKGHVWIQGDNVYESADLKFYGAVPYGLVQGSVFQGMAVRWIWICS